MTSPEFELAMTRTEYDQAIKSLVVASKLAARYQGELTQARATLAKIRTIVTGHEAALVVGRVLAALDEGSTQPEGSKS